MNNNDKKEEYYKEGPINNATRPLGKPRLNLNKTSFEDWNWEKEDPDFYRSYMKFPESKMPDQYRQVKWSRYH